jgi:hypothetical protein
MSTRGGIGVVDGDTGIRFVYQHFDSYPSGLAVEILAQYHKVGGDIERLRKEAITDHPAGWSSYPENPYPPDDEPMTATCRCGAGDYTHCNALFIEWLYVLNSSGLDVYKSEATGQTETNTRKSDGFQWESPLYRHIFVGTLSWDAGDGEVKAMEQRGGEISEAAYEETVL